MTLVIVGTGTEVGKTVVSSLVAARFGRQTPLAYWKPVATGRREGRDSETVAELAGERVVVLPESYLYDEPVSPHLAARLAGEPIVPEALLADFERHRAEVRALLIETAGGLLVPLTEEPAAPEETTMTPDLPHGWLQADLLVAMARRAALACLVVGRSELGTINHTLLTLEALRSRRLAVAGVVLNGPPHAENRRAIERLGGVPVWQLPPLEPLAASALLQAAESFDPEGRCGELLRAGCGVTGDGR
jgi:dethiobiotin synthetase